jgi:hypothetical protein
MLNNIVQYKLGSYLEKLNICPCPNQECPNHGNCKDCTSRHLKIGTLNYCSFYSILPVLEEAIKVSPNSPSAQKIKNLVERQTLAYMKLMDKHCISEENQAELRLEKSKVSAH